MCGKMTVRQRTIIPGQSVKYRILSGEKTGIWGLGGGLGAYNARMENLGTTWKKEFANRGILEVNSFDEKGTKFFLDEEGDMKLALLYDKYGDFVVITRPATGIVKSVHHRMPVLIAGFDDEWIKNGIIRSMDWNFSIKGRIPGILS